MSARLAALALAALVVAGCGARGAGPAGAAREFDPDSVADAYLRPSGALVLPGATRGFEVTADGSLYNGAWAVAFTPAAGGAPAGPPARIAALDRWRPVLRWTRRAGGVTWSFEAVAFTVPGGRDTSLAVSLRVRAHNASAAACAATLRAEFAPPDPDAAFLAWDAPDVPLAGAEWAGPGAGGTRFGWSESPAQGRAVDLAETLPAGGASEHRFVLPAYPLEAGALAALARVPHARRVADALAAADAALARGAGFALGDPETEAALRAATLLLLDCRERHAGLWLPIGGPFHYRDVWLRDGARAAQALALAGHTAEACSLAAGIASLQWPNGAFLTQRGQLDGTGQALWTFEQVLLRARPAPPLEPYAAAGGRALHWLERQRAAGAAGGWNHQALLPYADPHDGEFVRAQLTGDDAWGIAGERAQAHLLRAAGHAAEADSAAAACRAYAAAFAAALVRCGAADVPPSWQRVGRDWGNLAAGWPCAALPPADPHLAATAARAWAVAGGAGLVCYGGPDSLHGYLGADLGTWALLARRRAQADSVLAALLHWRTAGGTAAELFSRAGDFGRNLPPHPTHAAALVALVRNALLYDDEDTLRLTLGARAAWWRGAGVHGAPTWWGPLDLEFARRGGEASWRWTPVPVWTELTLPPGARLAAPPPPPLRAGGRADLVLAPPGTATARVRIETPPAR